jgi:hypothetical protein
MSTDDETPSTGPFAGVPQEVVQLCRSLTDYVEAAVQIRPDFTPETLPLVDHYAQTVGGALRERPEVLDLSAQAIGAYFGEVVRRHLAGFWLVPSRNWSDWLVCGEVAFVAINPIGVGYDAAVGSTQHHGPSSQLKLSSEDRDLVQARLEQLPEVPEREFFSLSTRFDVLEIVMEAVRAQAEARGYAEVTYDSRDYDGAVRPLGFL